MAISWGGKLAVALAGFARPSWVWSMAMMLITPGFFPRVFPSFREKMQIDLVSTAQADQAFPRFRSTTRSCLPPIRVGSNSCGAMQFRCAPGHRPVPDLERSSRSPAPARGALRSGADAPFLGRRRPYHRQCSDAPIRRVVSNGRSRGDRISRPGTHARIRGPGKARTRLGRLGASPRRHSTLAAPISDRSMQPSHPFVQLFLARLREFYREPEAIFWVYGFPLILAIALGIAFASKKPQPPAVDVVDSPDHQAAAAELQKGCVPTAWKWNCTARPTGGQQLSNRQDRPLHRAVGARIRLSLRSGPR